MEIKRIITLKNYLKEAKELCESEEFKQIANNERFSLEFVSGNPSKISISNVATVAGVVKEHVAPDKEISVYLAADNDLKIPEDNMMVRVTTKDEQPYCKNCVKLM